MSPREIELKFAINIDEATSILASVKHHLDSLHQHRASVPAHGQVSVEVEIRRLQRGYDKLHEAVAQGLAPKIVLV